jgi:hypothetical protein
MMELWTALSARTTITRYPDSSRVIYLLIRRPNRLPVKMAVVMLTGFVKKSPVSGLLKAAARKQRGALSCAR